MEIGKLNRKIQIKVKVSERDAYGVELIAYKNIGSAWAQVIPVSGREYFAAHQFIPESTVKFRIRYRCDFDESALITYEGVDYDILHLCEIGNKDGIEILAKKP